MTTSISFFILFVLGNCIALVAVIFLARLIFGLGGKSHGASAADNKISANTDAVIDVEFKTVETPKIDPIHAWCAIRNTKRTTITAQIPKPQQCVRARRGLRI